MCAGIAGSGAPLAHAEEAGPVQSRHEQSKFLRLSDAERFWFLEGAFRSLAVLVSTGDKARGECVADFYLKDRDRKRQQIEGTLRQAPDVAETTVIIALLEKACGKPLIPAAAR